MARKTRQVFENRTGGRGRKITVDTPLTIRELKFLDAYMVDGDAVEACKAAGYEGSASKLRGKASSLLRKANVAVEYRDRLNRMRKKSLASSEEVMAYLTSVMRGEIKDQFGLEAPLSERTRAAQELAKRTIDVENRAEGKADNVLQIKVDWTRD